MKKTITAILTIALLTAMLALSACGTTQTTTDETATEVATEVPEPTEIATPTETPTPIPTEEPTEPPTETPTPKPKKVFEKEVEQKFTEMTVLYDGQSYKLEIFSLTQFKNIFLRVREFEPFLRPDVTWDLKNMTIEVSESSSFINEDLYEGEERKVIEAINNQIQSANNDPDYRVKIISVVNKLDITFNENENEVYVNVRSIFISTDFPGEVNYSFAPIHILTEKNGVYEYVTIH